jgi:hypothetical protein
LLLQRLCAVDSAWGCVQHCNRLPNLWATLIRSIFQSPGFCAPQSGLPKVSGGFLEGHGTEREITAAMIKKEAEADKLCTAKYNLRRSTFLISFRVKDDENR